MELGHPSTGGCAAQRKAHRSDYQRDATCFEKTRWIHERSVCGGRAEGVARSFGAVCRNGTARRKELGPQRPELSGHQSQFPRSRAAIVTPTRTYLKRLPPHAPFLQLGRRAVKL